MSRFLFLFVCLAITVASVQAETNESRERPMVYRSHSGGSASADILVRGEAKSEEAPTDGLKARPSTEMMERAAAEKPSKGVKRVPLARSGGSAAAQLVEVPVQ